jgi:hypothetical protein
VRLRAPAAGGPRQPGGASTSSEPRPPPPPPPAPRAGCARAARLVTASTVLDITAAGTLTAACVAWAVHVAAVVAARKALASAFDGSPDAPGVLPPAPAWAAAEAAVAAAGHTLDGFKAVAATALAALTVRLAKYATFHPRLAVLPVALAAAGVDACHAAVTVGAVFVFFGVFGRLAFGSQLPGYATDGAAGVATIGFVQ